MTPSLKIMNWRFLRRTVICCKNIKERVFSHYLNSLLSSAAFLFLCSSSFLLLFHPVFTSICFGSYQILLAPHTNSLLAHSLDLLCWPPLAKCHTFPHKWSPPLVSDRHTRLQHPPPPPPPPNVFTSIHFVWHLWSAQGCYGTSFPVAWVRPLLVHSWPCFERSAKLPVVLPEQIHDGTQMWEAHILLLASCAKNLIFMCVCVCVHLCPCVTVCVLVDKVCVYSLLASLCPG